MSSSHWLITTLLGLEDLLARDLTGKGVNVIGVYPSRVLAESTIKPESRLAENITRVYALTPLTSTSTREVRLTLRSVLREAGQLKAILEESGRVRVKARSEGELSSRALTLIAARELKRCYKGLELSKSPSALTLRCELLTGKLIVGVEEAKGLHNREYTVFWHPAMINPLLASAMSMEAGLTPHSLIEDPFCGGATIPIEACLASEASAVAFDVNRGYVEGARRNVASSRLEGVVEVFQASILSPPLRHGSVDALLTDPPRGLRMPSKGLAKLYRALLKHAQEVLVDGGRLLVVTDKPSLVTRQLKGSRLKLVAERAVYAGGLKLRLLRLTLTGR